MADLLLKHSWDIFPSYVNVMTKYLIHFTANSKYIKGESDNIYLLLSGLSTVSHVFKIILRDTFDASIATTEAINAMFYYSQCIEQMDEQKMNEMDMDANIASIFVYKKTIGNICIEKQAVSGATITNNIENLISIYKKCAELLIGSTYEKNIPDQLMNLSMELCKNRTCEQDFKRDIENAMDFINHFPPDQPRLYDYILLYLKKYKGYPIPLLKKIHPEYWSKLHNESINNYIKWFFQG